MKLLVEFARPFRLTSPEYMIFLVKSNPLALLGESTEAVNLQKELLAELMEVCRITSGGSLNIVFDRFQADFGIRGAA